MAEIERLVGRCEGLAAPRPQPQLRRENRVRTVQASVAIEGNTLSLEQVSAVLEGKRVIGPRREIREVENAIAAYDLAPSLDPWSERVGGLLDWGRREAAMPLLLQSCAVHYELQFIHPFSDGNGRIGRLWQHAVLLRSSPVFEWVPFESVIKARQREYYDALGRSD